MQSQENGSKGILSADPTIPSAGPPPAQPGLHAVRSARHTGTRSGMLVLPNLPYPGYADANASLAWAPLTIFPGPRDDLCPRSAGRSRLIGLECSARDRSQESGVRRQKAEGRRQGADGRYSPRATDRNCRHAQGMPSALMCIASLGVLDGPRIAP